MVFVPTYVADACIAAFSRIEGRPEQCHWMIQWDGRAVLTIDSRLNQPMSCDLALPMGSQIKNAIAFGSQLEDRGSVLELSRRLFTVSRQAMDSVKKPGPTQIASNSDLEVHCFSAPAMIILPLLHGDDTKKFNSSAIDPWSVFEIITMGKKAKNITGTKASVKESGSSWSPAMDGIPEPSSVEQARHGSSVEVLRAQTVEGFQGNMSC
ncbi:hypothetical protein V6N13_052765 [Hibiscus sabdariffa]